MSHGVTDPHSYAQSIKQLVHLHTFRPVIPGHFSISMCLAHTRHVAIVICMRCRACVLDDLPSLQTVGVVGTVCGIDEDHDIVVVYPSKNRSVLMSACHICHTLYAPFRWTLNPAVLTRVAAVEPSVPGDGPHFQPFQVDDVVKVISDAVMVRRMQKGHGEWVESMREVKCKMIALWVKGIFHSQMRCI